MLLSGIVGGGVSSRLFQSLREKAGLAYSVFSNVNFWSDTGAFSVYFCVDPRNLQPALTIFEREMDKLRGGVVIPEALDEIAETVRGQLAALAVAVTGWITSPIRGTGGNTEYLALLAPAPNA